MAFDYVEAHWPSLKLILRNKQAKTNNRSPTQIQEYLLSSEEYLTGIIKEKDS